MEVELSAEVMGATLVGGIKPAGNIRGVVIDSRKAEPGALFAALPGEHTDGHDWVDAAFRAGAVAALVTRELPGNLHPLLVVPDTQDALWTLAAWWRVQRDPQVVAITGSVGKTSVKEMVAAICAKTASTLATTGNYNNELGVPLTLLRLEPAHQFAVIEIGMRGAGQITPLVRVARPNVAVITNIGISHIELLGSQEAIARAKAEVFSTLTDAGTAVIPRDTPFYDLLLSLVPREAKFITFSGNGDNRADVVLAGGGDALIVRGERFELAPQAVGAHVATNAACAVASALALGLDIRQAVQAVNEWQGAEGRMHIRRVAQHDITVLDDCYNAGKESMLSALATLKAWRGAVRRVAVLGDMRELGPFTAEAHRSVGAAVKGADVELLFVVGEFSGYTVEGARLAGYEGAILEFDAAADAVDQVGAQLQQGDVVLVKGSRAVGLEVIVEAIAGQRSTYHG